MSLINVLEAELSAKWELWNRGLGDLIFDPLPADPGLIAPGAPVASTRTVVVNDLGSEYEVMFALSSATSVGGEPTILLDKALSSPTSPVVAAEPVFDQ